jgi:CDP-diacylglycerol--glycerol-3-phosphate 3-phosphatidyltransferase
VEQAGQLARPITSRSLVQIHPPLLLVDEMEKEKIINVPNFITLWRIPLVLISIYYLFSNNLILATLFFVLAGLTDLLDGFFARKFDQVTHFGEWFDVIADRVFVLIFVLSLGIHFSFQGNTVGLILLGICFTREIFSIPAIIIRKVRNKSLYSVRFIGKLQTAIQIVALGTLVGFPAIALPIVIISGINGLIAVGIYTKDSFK